MGERYARFLIDYNLKVNDSISDEFIETFQDYYASGHVSSDDEMFDEDSSEETKSEMDDENSSSNEVDDDVTVGVYSEADFSFVSDDVKAFMIATCKCKKGTKGKPCSFSFKPNEVNEIRESCILRDSWEKGINLLNELVLGALNCCVRSSDINSKRNSRINNHSMYRLRDQVVCLKMFLFAHAFSSKRYKNLRKRLNASGVELEYSGHMNNKNNSTSKETTENIVNFVKNFAAINGYPQPGRVSTIRNCEILLQLK